MGQFVTGSESPRRPSFASNGTATDYGDADPDDYFAYLGSLTFDQWQTQQFIDIMINDDAEYEGDEHFFVNLFNATNATIDDSEGQVTIVDDEMAPDLIAVALTAGTMDDFQLDYTVSGSVSSSYTIGLYESDDGSNYDPMDDLLASTGGETFADTHSHTFHAAPTKNYVVAVLDVDGMVAETEEMNNTAAEEVILLPEMELRLEADDGSGGSYFYDLYDGDYVYFDDTVTGVPVSETFQVHNAGDGDLTLDLTTTILPPGFSFSALPDTTIAPGGSSEFTVQLDATAADYFFGTLELANNDSDEAPFHVYLEGNVTAPQPEIEMRVDNDGYDSNVELFDWMSSVDFGSTTVGTSVTRTFTVENDTTASGDLTVNFGSISLPEGFLFSGPSADVTLAPGGSTTFSVQLDTTAAEYFSGTLELPNNDSDEDPFHVDLYGEVNDPLSLYNGVFDYLMPGETTTDSFQYTTGDGNGGSDTGMVLIAIAPPVVTITASDPDAAEAGLDAGQFKVTRTGPTTNALTVNYTVAGAATEGTDYDLKDGATVLSGTIDIPAGATFKVFDVAPKPDADEEIDEDVKLTVAAAAAYAVGMPNSAVVFIADDDGKVDIDADIDRDDIVENVQDEPGELSQGIVVIRDHDGVYADPNEPARRRAVVLRNAVANEQVVLKRSSNRVKLFAANNGGADLFGAANEVTLAPNTYYVQGGAAASPGVRQDWLKVRRDIGGAIFTDQLNITVIWVDIS